MRETATVETIAIIFPVLAAQAIERLAVVIIRVVPVAVAVGARQVEEVRLAILDQLFDALALVFALSSAALGCDASRRVACSTANRQYHLKPRATLAVRDGE